MAIDSLDYIGHWSGALTLPSGKLNVIIEIKQLGEDVVAKLNVPAQGLVDMQADSINIEDHRLSIVWGQISSKYVGEISQLGRSISGHWHQNGAVLPLDIERTERESLININRPQEPQLPLPYEVVQLDLQGGAKGVKLSGTLTKPRREGPFATVILITGSGPQDRNETLLDHKPFLVVSDYLTRRGYAVFRYDDRGVSKSTGDFAAATTEDFARDLAAIRNALVQRDDIDADCIIYLGHSEGGMVAPMAHTRFAKANALVLIAPPAVPLADVLIEQQKRIMASSGLPNTVIDQQFQLQTKLNTIMLTSSSLVEAKNEIITLMQQSGTPLEQIDQQVNAFVTPWFRYGLGYDPASDMVNIDVPVLVIFGEKDLQVSPKQNAEAMENILAKAPSSQKQIVVLEGLNHLMQPAKTGNPSEYASIEITFAKKALEQIQVFLAKNVKK